MEAFLLAHKTATVKGQQRKFLIVPLSKVSHKAHIGLCYNTLDVYNMDISASTFLISMQTLKRISNFVKEANVKHDQNILRIHILCSVMVKDVICQ